MTIDDRARHALTVTAPANGHVTGTTGSDDSPTTVIDCGSGGRTDCGETLVAGTEVTLTATADAGYLFGDWTGACSGTGTCTLTLNADSTVGATFGAARDLIVTAPSHGKVTGSVGATTVIDCGSDCSETVADGTTVALRAGPDSGYRFDRWGDACATETSADCNVTLTRDRTVSVTFIAAAVNGQCDNATRNACAAGTPNDAAVADTSTHYRWRCDGGYGGSDSGTCEKGIQIDGQCDNATRNACTAGTPNDGAVADTSTHYRWRCDGGYGGSDSGTCEKGIQIDGQCDNATRNACTAGTPNDGAVADTSTHHRWRCDGGYGGSASGTCEKRKTDCAAGERSWSAGGYSCAGSIASAASGQTASARDTVDPTRGSAAYKCDNGTWSEQSGSTCTVNLQCGQSENTCLPDGVQMTDTSDTAAVPGQCADTESEGCVANTTYRNRTDIRLENGACGAGRYGCDGGVSTRLSGTTTKYRWRCEGIDAEDRWSCLGIDGSKNWQCGYASQSLSCDIAVNATDHYSCSDVTRDATDELCFACRTGYEECGYDCHAACDAANHERRDASTCGCVCEAGYHRDGNGNCVVNPMCSDPLVENTCKAGRPMDFRNTAIHGVCEPTKAERCEGGRFRDGIDKAAVDGVCGTKKDACAPGTLRNQRDEDSKYIWDCLGMPGAKNWSCLGTDGQKKWNCQSGVQTDACQVDSEGVDRQCQEIVPASNALNCFACKPSYEMCNGDCHAVCGTNAMRNTDNCTCECKAGTVSIGDECKRVHKLEVSPKPANCHITVPTGVPGPNGEKADGISCGSNGNNCFEYYVENTRVTASKTAEAGYGCTWKGSCPGSCMMDRSKNISASGEYTLEALPGGNNGTYTATFTRVRLPPPLGYSSFYTARVTATARGGVKPYKFKWAGKSTGASAVYLYRTLSTTGERVLVTVTDKKTKTATATATIKPPSTSGIQGASDDEAVAFEVPLAGELYFIWGGDGDVRASSQDTSVASVTVSSPGIRNLRRGHGRDIRGRKH